MRTEALNANMQCVPYKPFPVALELLKAVCSFIII